MTDQIDKNYNLAIWDEVEETDPNYTKSFNRGGGFKGTATNATYLAKKATKMFGPMGIGWGIKVLNEQIMEGGEGDKVHRIHAQFWYIWNGQRGEIEQFGQTMFVGRNRNGVYTDEEAPKKSLTDAMSKCLSLLGFAADVHLGLYDDNGYVNDLKREYRDDDEFSRDRRRDDGPEDREDKPAPDKGKTRDKGSKKDREDESRDKDDRGDDRRDDDPPKDEVSDEEFVVILKKEIDAKDTMNKLTDYMNHKDTTKDIQSLPKDLQKEVRDYATKKLKAMGWPNNAGKDSKGEKEK